MTKTRKRTTKTTHGTSLPVGVGALLLTVALSMHWPACAKDNKPKAQAYAIVGGTVFRESGLVLPGAEVTLRPDPVTPGAKTGKPQKQVSDARGEFAFRVPAEPMRYRVTAAAKHLRTEEKTVEIQADERANVTLTLPESSNK